jgi:hypothetical protein
MQKGVPKRCQRLRRKARELVAERFTFQADSSSDEYCPHCDNHYVIDAITPKAALKVESEDTRVDARLVDFQGPRAKTYKLPRMLKDDRIRSEPPRTIFNVPDAGDRLG